VKVADMSGVTFSRLRSSWS